MLALLRRCRIVAAVLLALSPGVTGAAVPLLHPCPVDMPTMLGSGMAATMATHGGMPQADDHASHHACTCLGVCSPSGAALAPTPGVTVGVRLATMVEPEAAGSDWGLPTARPTDYLPPSTAPPTPV